MDFHSLMRRDLQSLCKKNKIPANMTNISMADALKALEIVQGLDEYLNQSESNAPPQSPISLAKQPPVTVTRTTRRKTTMKAEPQPSSQLVNRSCRSTNKSLAGEMDQENVNKNVAQESKSNNVKFEASVAKTPAARSTRKASAATSCGSKAQESKKDELVQSVYSTRRSTRLLEKCMADLSLKTKETVEDKPAKNEDTEQKVSAQDNNPSGSEEKNEEAEVIPSRDLSASMEKEWETLKNDSDKVVGDLEVYVDLGDIAVVDANTENNEEKMNEISVFDANTVTKTEKMNEIAVFDAITETKREKMKEVMRNEKGSENSLVQVDKQEEETLPAMCEEGLKKDDNDEEIGGIEIYVVDLGDISVMKHATTEENNDKKESKNVLDQQEIEETIEENDSEPEEIDTMVDQTDSDAGDSETEPEEDNKAESKNVLAFDSLVQVDQQEIEETVQENDSEPEKISNTFDEETMVDQTNSDPKAESEEEEDDNADKPEEEEEGTISDVDSNQTLFGSDIIEENDFEPKDTMVDQTNGGDSETESEEDKSGPGADSDDTVSYADSNQAVMGSDIADEEEMVVSEPVGYAAAAPTCPSLLEEAKVETTPLSPFAAESISLQFPRPSKPTTTPSKNSALKLVNVDNENKENNMEMMMMNVKNGESKGEEAKKIKKVEFDEENLKDVSMRQLVKMVKELSIKTSNRTALQIIPSNNQTAE